MARKPKPTPAESLAELERLLAKYTKGNPTNGGVYWYAITKIPRPVRKGIFFYSRGWGWRLHKDWQAVLEQRRKELLPNPPPR